MERALFFISCTTCQARLAVRDESAIGAILSCPKCESMVQVVPPPGWKPGQHVPDSAEDHERPAKETAKKDTSPARGELSPKGGAVPAKSAVPGKAKAVTDKPAKQAWGDKPSPASKPKNNAGTAAQDPKVEIDPALLADTVDDFPELQRPLSERSAKARAAKRPAAPPPLPSGGAPREKPEESLRPEGDQQQTAASIAAAGAASVADSTLDPSTSPAMLPPRNWTSPAEMMWRKWLVLITAPIAGLVLAVGVVMLFSSSNREKEPDDKVVEAPVDPPPKPEPAPEPAPEPLPDRLDARWIPDATRMLFSLRAAELEAQPDVGRLLDATDPVGRKQLERVLSHFGLSWPSVARIYGASTDLGAWIDNAVVVIELAEDRDAARYQSRGEAAGFSLAGVPCRREPGTSWPHPYAAVHPRVLVTGPAELLRRLADRSEPNLQSAPIRQMLDASRPDLDAVWMVDLAAARSAGWKLPVSLMDVWPVGREAWHVAWEMPQGAGVALRADDKVHAELTLICESETSADKVRTALEQLVAAGQNALDGQLVALTAQIEAGEIKVDAAAPYETLLKQTQSGLKTAQCDVTATAVSLRMAWQRSPADLAAALLASRGAVRRDWYAAALAVDRQKQERILTALGGYQHAEGKFPPGAGGGALLSPESRLSWIAMMLPYLGQRDWHQQLDFGYPWNGSPNNKVTRQPLEAVINPALGPSQTKAGFPVTHYVGVAGFGKDAGKLPADDPRAGVFGFGRQTALDDITDGASNTIAVLGVSGRLGAWGSGGDPTVRALTQAPYVNGPDGFGSGQPDGMLAGMADGSVRFISKDVDPHVLELLATARGGGDVTVAALDPKKPEVPAPKPKKPDPDKVAVEPKPKPPEETPEAPKVELPKIDVKARLETKVAGINLPNIPLGKVIEAIESLSALPITLDVETIEQLGVSLDDPITFKMTDTTIGQILEAALARRGLVYAIEGNYVLVTRPMQQREALAPVRYSVSDLVGGDADDPEELAGLLVRLVAPESWQPAGGRGKIDVHDDVIICEQTDVVQGQVLTFFEKLRTARGKPLRSQLDPQRFTLDTHLDRAREQLQRPVTANFIEPTSLVEIVQYLEEDGQTTIVVDWPALGAAGVWVDATGTLKADKRPLSEALARLLGPMRLTCRVVGEDTIQVTSRKAADSQLDLEFYKVADLVDAGRAPEDLLKKIKADVAPATWQDAGGPGLIHYDPQGRCFLVLQSQPVQGELEGLLRQWRSEKKP